MSVFLPTRSHAVLQGHWGKGGVEVHEGVPHLANALAYMSTYTHTCTHNHTCRDAHTHTHTHTGLPACSPRGSSASSACNGSSCEHDHGGVDKSVRVLAGYEDGSLRLFGAVGGGRGLSSNVRSPQARAKRGGYADVEGRGLGGDGGYWAGL